MTYLRVRNWEKFQHYKDRNPPWIKNYIELLNDDDHYRSLTFHRRGILHGLWLAYAASRRQLRDDTVTLTRLLGQRVTTADLQALNQAGFITVGASKPASKPLARRYHSRASARSQEAETERTKDSPSSSTPIEGHNPPAPFTTPQDLQPGLGSDSMGHALRLLAVLAKKDEGTKARILSYATRLPPAAFEQVREKILDNNGHIKNDGGYACSELERLATDKERVTA